MFPNLQSLFWFRQNCWPWNPYASLQDGKCQPVCAPFQPHELSQALCSPSPHVDCVHTVRCSCPLICASPGILRLCGRLIYTLQLYLCLLKTMQFEWQNGPLGISLGSELCLFVANPHDVGKHPTTQFRQRLEQLMSQFPMLKKQNNWMHNDVKSSIDDIMQRNDMLCRIMSKQHDPFEWHCMWGTNKSYILILISLNSYNNSLQATRNRIPPILSRDTL